MVYTAVLLGWAVFEKTMKYPQILSKEGREKMEEEEKRGVRRNGGGDVNGGGGGRGKEEVGYVFDVRDVRLALVFLFFVHLGFFGIGK